MDWLNKYWPVIVGVIMCIVAFSETRLSVFFNTKEIEQQAQSNRAQWQKISDHESRISRLEGIVE